MLPGHKSTTHKPNRKDDKKKLTGINVKVIKHFQPKLINHNKIIGQKEFPEVNSEFDIIQNTDIVKTKSYSDKFSFKGKNIKSGFYRELINKQNHCSKEIKTIFSPIRHNFKSKSDVGKRSAIVKNNNYTLKSKSFGDIAPKDITNYTSDTSSSSSGNEDLTNYNFATDTPLDKIKKEILINRIEGFRFPYTCLQRKEKIEHFRKQVGLLVNPSINNAKFENQPSDKQKSPNYFVYNVKQKQGKEENNSQSNAEVVTQISTGKKLSTEKNLQSKFSLLIYILLLILHL